MIVQNTKLLLRPKPFIDESIVGYMLRLAEANGYETFSWILQLFKIGMYVNKNNYVYGVSDLKTAAGMIDVEEDLLKNLAYKPVNISSPKTLIGTYEGFGQTIPIFLMQIKNPKICPKCLTETSYCRKIWELKIITVCPKHKCLLLDKCPGCNGKLKWNRRKICECKCGFDWREADSILAPDNELRLVTHFYNLFGLSKTQTSNFPDCLLPLNFNDLLSLIFMVIGQTRGRGDLQGKNLSKTLSNFELHKEFSNAIEVYENFPNNFFNFLDLVKQEYFRKAPQNTKYDDLTLFRKTILGGIIRVLFDPQFDGRFDLFRSAFNEYYSRERLQIVSVNTDYNTLSATELMRSYISLSATKNILKITPEAIKTLIDSGNLKALEGKNKSGRKAWFVEKKSVLSCEKTLRDCISIPQITSELGIPNSHVHSLIEHNFLNELKGLYISSTFCRVFSRREMNKITEIFNNSLQQKQKTNISKFLNSNETAFRLGRLGIDFGAFVKIIRSGKIRPVGKGKRHGLLGYYYDEVEINAFCEGKLNLLKTGNVSLAETEKQINTSRILIRQLIENDLLKQVDTGKVNFLKLRINQKSVEKFKKLYVLSTELAVQYKTTPQTINELLDELNIKPIENIFNGNCFVYKRNEVSIVQLEKKTKSYPTTPLLTIEETAKFLDSSVDAVAVLVNNGVLQPYRKYRNLKNKELLFTEGGIKVYKQLEIDGLKCLSRKSAAKFLGLGMQSFKSRYINTKKISPIKIEHKTKRIFYYISDIEKLRDLELNGIRSSEVAEILEVNISCVNKLTLAGELMPVSGPSIDGFQYNVYIRSDVEQLKTKRQIFKEKQLKAGKSSRFGRISGNRYSKNSST